jgi:hypothetical protein
MEICEWCFEEIEDGQRWDEDEPMHTECFARATTGGLGQLLYGLNEDSHHEDPPGFSKRDAARAAWEYAKARRIVAEHFLRVLKGENLPMSRLVDDIRRE